MLEADERITNKVTAVINGNKLKIELLIEGVNESIEGLVTENDEELAISRLIYLILSELTEYKPSWGVLTGIRPIKFYH